MEELGANSKTLLKAVASGQSQCLAKLLESEDHVKNSKDVEKAVLLSAQEGKVDCIEVLLGSEAIVKPSKEILNRALMLATRGGHEECLNALIKAGASVNDVNSAGETALFIAMEKLRPNCMKLLLDAGADVNKSDSQGNTVLLKNESCDITCGELLLKAGADVNCVNMIMESPLMIAMSRQNHEYGQMLIKSGASVNRPKNNGSTPLFRAVESRNIQCVKLLLKSGASVNQESNEGLNALQHYLNYNTVFNQELALLLIAAGAKIVTNHMKRQEVMGFYSNKFASQLAACLPKSDSIWSLKETSREKIRSCLEAVPWFSNFFCLVPELRLPTSLALYLLNNMKLD